MKTTLIILGILFLLFQYAIFADKEKDREIYSKLDFILYLIPFGGIVLLCKRLRESYRNIKK